VYLADASMERLVVDQQLRRPGFTMSCSAESDAGLVTLISSKIE
jgi:hypothetical protein